MAVSLGLQPSEDARIEPETHGHLGLSYFAQPYHASKQVAAAWLSVYHNSEKEWDLYELAERLVDLDYKFQLWRFSHMKTVERIIGYKRGTGGTGGVSYLTKALELKFFPELWTIRTSM